VIAPFVLNRLPVFLENLPVSGKKQGTFDWLLSRQGELSSGKGRGDEEADDRRSLLRRHEATSGTLA
jgi:hypothetical protein